MSLMTTTREVQIQTLQSNHMLSRNTSPQSGYGVSRERRPTDNGAKQRGLTERERVDRDFAFFL